MRTLIKKDGSPILVTAMHLLQTLKSSLAIALMLAGLAAFTLPQAPPDEDVPREFYTHRGPEATLMDPLILAGKRVVPAVMEKVKDKDMPRRRYAIGFLGNGSYAQALPVLQAILRDDGEEDYFRADALQSIYMIDGELGLRRAEQLKGRPDELGKVSRDLLGGRQLLPARRSYFAALTSQTP